MKLTNFIILKSNPKILLKSFKNSKKWDFYSDIPNIAHTL